MILPDTARVNHLNHLEIGGCDTVALAREYGTPLYLFDEVTIRNQCQSYLHGFRRLYTNSQVLYASKAYLGIGLARLLRDEGMGLDVVSGGELFVAQTVDFPREKVYFHGNNKSAEELAQALEWGVGRFVVDNFHEMALLNQLALNRGIKASILLRITPGVDPHTHVHITTGILDSKFGFPLAGGQAEEAVVLAMRSPGLNLVGLHVHIGSQIFELDPYEQAIRILFDFAAEMNQKHGMELQEFSPGGGWAVAYQDSDDPPGQEKLIRTIVQAVKEGFNRHRLRRPRLIVEPGRSIIARAGVALYTVGATKDIPSIRRYVSLDGGIADNIRPALYGARYSALCANKAGDPASETVSLAGKYCESGDILVKDVALPHLDAGDLVAIPTAGAYCIPLASNYNMALRPPIVVVRDGRSRLWRGRETYEDLIRHEVR